MVDDLSAELLVLVHGIGFIEDAVMVFLQACAAKDIVGVLTSIDVDPG